MIVIGPTRDKRKHSGVQRGCCASVSHCLEDRWTVLANAKGESSTSQALQLVVPPKIQSILSTNLAVRIELLLFMSELGILRSSFGCPPVTRSDVAVRDGRLESCFSYSTYTTSR